METPSNTAHASPGAHPSLPTAAASSSATILFGSTSRRHRLPRLYASRLSCNLTSFARNPMARQAGPMRRLLAFLDPLLGRAPFIVEAHDRPARQAQICDDEADSREQFPEAELHLRHHPSRRFPTDRLVEKAFVPLIFTQLVRWPSIRYGALFHFATIPSRSISQAAWNRDTPVPSMCLANRTADRLLGIMRRSSRLRSMSGSSRRSRPFSQSRSKA